MRCRIAGAVAKSILPALIAFSAFIGARAAEVKPLLEEWFEKQSRLQRWQADFIQTRRLAALNEPLRTPGRVWFSAPDQFRWELGDPPKTIAVRQEEQMLVVYPRLKTVEQYSMEANRTSPWRSALTLLEAGFPRSRQMFQKRFRVLSLKDRDQVHVLEIEPRSATVREWMPRIVIELSSGALQLEATELQFADGSILRNDFTGQQVNPTFPPELFEQEIGPDYRRVEPGRQ